MFELGIKFLLSYFLGSIMGALTMGKLNGGVDIRNMGSGNAGGTNALRTQGKVFALGVIIIDIGKGVIATLLIPFLVLPLVIQEPQISREILILCCAFASVMGHVWPLWYQFKGGKGAATLIGTLLVISPFLVVVMLATFIIILVMFGYVGLATMLATASITIYLLITESASNNPVLVYSLLMSLYLIYTHRSNIQRMLAGRETKNKKIMIFSKR
ncbi:MAG: glycerol-3-phosphate 1-O-acyltransferase PlsY [Woeseiaceae bacterium]|nr:glycerol-3-phosphate 1-O-acyltransferase PlsY [Woeseiaceae bacterium]MDG1016760.1 glycerol-3-phosphate 1-O-acyltransferase PlsY [Woeseiaceae bacterium]MDG1712545.1 glycerol-3-phosphate 1-O-acyltransferase PlsY [Woeseiaceae bacterium]MDG1865057.1 glycerol-3-phosphate 1-O-acyltransferase PlsY [Woeseiaceae bacterium]